MRDHTESYLPDIPLKPLGIGLLGCGAIALSAHLPAYQKWGLPVVGAYDVFPDALARAVDKFSVTPFASVDELLGDPAVEIVDVAVRTEDRAPLIMRALHAGKHVLSQKPFATSLEEAREIVSLAAEVGRVIAVNQNGRWAPAWRIATEWLLSGEIGDVRAVRHSFTTSFEWTVETHFNEMEHFVLYDYAAHWFDICRCWLAGKRVVSVRAWDSRAPHQGADSHTPWNMFAEVTCDDGTVASIQGTGAAPAQSGSHHSFEIVGSKAVVRGEVLDREWVSMSTDIGTRRLTPNGAWFPDGFAGSMGEVQSAVRSGREPYNSGRHVLASLEIGLAAVESADNSGAIVAVGIDA